MKKIRRACLLLAVLLTLCIGVNSMVSYGAEPGWIYGDYETTIEDKDFTMEIGFESGTDYWYMYLTGYHTDVYEQLDTNDGKIFWGVNDDYYLFYNGVDMITMYYGYDGVGTDFHKVRDASHYAD